jgi:hypothetical protein
VFFLEKKTGWIYLAGGEKRSLAVSKP